MLNVPRMGAGLSLRAEYEADLLARPEAVDVVEILTDRYVYNPWRMGELERAAAAFEHLIPHGVHLSLGSPTPPPRSYLERLKDICRRVRAPYYSDHLAVTSMPGIRLDNLTPLWLTEDTLARTCQHVRLVQDLLEMPLVIENIADLVDLPQVGMSREEFLTRLCDATNCGLLLDLANLHANAVNNLGDDAATPIQAYQMLEGLPLGAVVGVHMAGGFFLDGVLVDGHCAPPPEACWAMLDWLLARSTVSSVVIEYDDRFPPFEELVGQVARARRAMESKVAG